MMSAEIPGALVEIGTTHAEALHLCDDVASEQNIDRFALLHDELRPE